MDARSNEGIVRDLAGIGMTETDLKAINESINQNPNSLLECGIVRVRLAEARLKRSMAAASVQALKTDSDQIIENAVEHNLNGLLQGNASARPDKLINVLKSIDYVQKYRDVLKVLSVGPRSEIEIFSLIAAGFRSSNVRGLDLISYSPFVDLGDMHSMPYGAASFDIVILGWVLAYSKDHPKAVAEVLRVAKPGALVAVGCEFNPLTSDELLKSGGILGADYPRFYRTDDILKLFDGHIDQVIFRHDVRSEMKNEIGAIMTVFQVK